jgi:mannose-P-dolichol utilization defect protein 1
MMKFRLPLKYVVLALCAVCYWSLVLANKDADEDSKIPPEKTVLLVFSEQCYDTLLHKDFFDVPCLRSVASKLVGLAIIAGSFALKAPQIFNIIAAKSGRGLSLPSLYLDALTFICPAVYSYRQGHNILSYGESIVILVQNVIIVLLVWSFTTPPISIAKKLLCACTFGAAIVTGLYLLPQDMLPILPTLAILLTVTSRSDQIVSTFRTKSSGVASSVTWGLNFVGAVVRVLTTLNETGDMFQLAGFAIGATCSFVILIQIMIYGDAKKEK